MKTEKVYETNNAIVLGFIIIGYLFNFFWCYYIAISVLSISVFSAFGAKKIAQFWLYIGKILGYINSKIILGLFFFLLLMPFALIIRFFMKKKNAIKTSNWESNHQHLDFTKPF
jgi:hypothetical protein